VTSSRPAGLKLPLLARSGAPGKMMKKDGERNTARFDGNHQDTGTMSNAVLALGADAYFLDDERYARKAAEDIAVWFENPGTRMNPNLHHAHCPAGGFRQVGRGACDRGQEVVWRISGVAAHQ
jgi:hypothetical protein